MPRSARGRHGDVPTLDTRIIKGRLKRPAESVAHRVRGFARHRPWHAPCNRLAYSAYVSIEKLQHSSLVLSPCVIAQVHVTGAPDRPHLLGLGGSVEHLHRFL